MRSAVQWITGVEDVNERYSRAEEIVDIFFEYFLDLHTCKTESICSNDGESRQIQKQIQTLLKKVKKNEHSIVFHTADEYHLQVLMTGDVATDSMDEIAKNLATPSVPIKDCYHVFKAPHHGTSTHLYCTNHIRERCEYLEKHNQCASVCVDCKAGGTRVNCSVINKTSHHVPEIIWNPDGIDNFKKALLKTRQVQITWEYRDSKKEVNLWRANRVKATTNLRNNIESRLQWIKKDENGLVKVYVEVI